MHAPYLVHRIVAWFALLMAVAIPIFTIVDLVNGRRFTAGFLLDGPLYIGAFMGAESASLLLARWHFQNSKRPEDL